MDGQTNSISFFQGSVMEAVARSKMQQMLLVVVIQNENAESVKMDAETWSNKELGTLLAQKSVALKLKWDSQDGKNFYSIYPVMVCPTVYFITINGKPLKAIVGFKPAQEMIKELNDLHQLHLNQAQLVPNTENVNSSNSSTSPSVNSPQSTPVSSPLPTPISPPIVHASVNNNNSTLESVSQPKSEAKSLTAEQIAEQKRQLEAKIQETKLKKQEELKKLEKEREMQRRLTGKDQQEGMKKWEEEKKKREKEEADKEKKEARLAQKKIKEQIERDRQERKTKLEKGKTENPSTITSPIATSSLPTTSNSSTTNIAFRLLNGETLKQQFQAEDKLAVIKSFIKTTCNYKNFILLTSFPRHTFLESEMNMSLRQLNLVPSATILISLIESDTPKQQNQSSYTQALAPRPPTSYMDYVFNIISYFKYFCSRLFGFRSGDTPPTEPRNEPQVLPTNPQRTVGSTNTANQRTVHTLNNDNSDDDTNSYWNGNSTQQK